MGAPVIALITFATGGERYTKFIDPLFASAMKFMPSHYPVVFTDDTKPHGAVHCQIKHEDWPLGSMNRFAHLAHRREFLERFDHLLMLDVDMIVCAKIEASDLFGEGLTAVVHPGYPNSWEENTKSAAYIPKQLRKTYYQGCVIGGPAQDFLAMAAIIAQNIDCDRENGITAIWHDESHLNRYLAVRPPTIELSPAYAYPEPRYLVYPERWQKLGWEPKIRHLEKPEQGLWKDEARERDAARK